MAKSGAAAGVPAYGVGMSVEAAHAAGLLMLLSHPVRLRAFAELARHGKDGATIFEISLHLDLPEPEVGELLGRLVGAGVATGTGNGIYRARDGVLREAAQALDRVQPVGPLLAEYPQLKSYFSHGRLVSLPPTLSERAKQMAELFARFIAVEGVLTEAEINARITPAADDVAAVRRMLVESGWLERDRAGTSYGSARTLTPTP
jgi:DNA-binding transcriptional ArsR family regulator